MRLYILRYGFKPDGTGSEVEPVYEEVIDALSDEEAIELAKDSEWLATRGAANVVQLVDDEGLVIWLKHLKRGSKDAIS